MDRYISEINPATYDVPVALSLSQFSVNMYMVMVGWKCITAMLLYLLKIYYFLRGASALKKGFLLDTLPYLCLNLM